MDTYWSNFSTPDTQQKSSTTSWPNNTLFLLFDEAPKLTRSASVKAAVLCAMAAASLIGNSVTLISIAVNKKGNSSSLYSLLKQLAVSDLLVSIWCLSGEAAWTYTVEWKGGDVLCRIFKFSQVLIGFDRLRAIRRPINHRSCIKPIIGAWLLSALFASPQLVIFSVLMGPFREPFYQCVTYGFYTEESWQEKLYTIFSLLTMFVIPLVILIACYVCIFCTIAKKERAFLMRAPHPSMERWPADSPMCLRSRENLHLNTSSSRRLSFSRRRNNIFKRAKMKSLRISIIIVTAFVICWAPYYFMMITFIFLNPNDKLGEELQSAIFFFGMSNSLVNPLIYGAFHLWPSSGSREGKAPGSFSTAFTESVRGGLVSGRQRRQELAPQQHRLPLDAQKPLDESAATTTNVNEQQHHVAHKRCSLHYRRQSLQPKRYRTCSTGL